MMRFVYCSGKSTVRSRVESDRSRRLPQPGIVREASAVSIDDALRLRLWKGVVNCRVEGTEEN